MIYHLIDFVFVFCKLGLFWK